MKGKVIKREKQPKSLTLFCCNIGFVATIFFVGGGGRNTGTTPVDRCICCLMSKQNIFFLAQNRGVCVCLK